MQIRMPNAEIRKKPEDRSPNIHARCFSSNLEFRASFGFRHSDFGILLLLCSFAASCVSDRQQKSNPVEARLVWPSPPDEPRIAYVKSIATPADIGRSPSSFKRMVGFITGESAERDNMVKPFGVALDETGNLCLTDTGNNSVLYCDLLHKQWRRWPGVDKTRFASPVAIVKKNGTFYVADSELGKVIAFDENNRALFTITEPLQRPAGLALAGDSLFVVDSQAHAVFAFDLRGQFRSQFGKRGVGPGEFNFPTHITSDNSGHLLVTDSLNNRIQVFQHDGKFISEFGSAGDAPGHFGRPKGVAADSFGHIYVVDAVFDNIQVFDSSGRLLLNLGQGGAKPGQFGVPAGIAVGADNQIYVADSYNRRVQVFKYIGGQ